MRARIIRRPGRAGIALMAGVVLLGAAAALLALDAAGAFTAHVYSTPDTGTAFNVTSIVHPGTALDPAAGSGDGPRPARLLIPRIGVDAPVIVKGIGADGVMQVPDNGSDAAWYDFSARPGAGGNAVFSGHVDFHGVGPAVFWDLGKLNEGDAIDVRLADGSTVAYHVTGKGTFDADSAPVADIVGATPVDSVTIITCTGVFNQSTHQYNKRLVVRAELDGAQQPSAVAPGR